MGIFKRKKKQQSIRQSSDVNRPKEQKVFSYYTASHKQLNSIERTSRSKVAITESTSRHLKRIQRNWFMAFVGIVLLASSVYLLTLSTTPQIEISGTKYRSEAQYLEKAQASLSTTIFNRFKPTLQREKLEANLKSQFPEAKTVTVSSPLLGRRPVVMLVMDEPAAVLKQSNSQDLIVSQRGEVIAYSRSK